MRFTNINATKLRCTFPVHAPGDDGPAADFPGRDECADAFGEIG